MDKPHLVLNWTFDVPNYKLFCKIGDDLEYIAHEGGTLPYTKIYKGVTTAIDPGSEWIEEKHWISENYGETVGYYQPDGERQRKHPIYGWTEFSPHGFGLDGRYLDHMQRMQILMEGNDMAMVWGGGKEALFLTPDCGKTIYKRIPTRDVNYLEKDTDPDIWWSEWPQACGQQPRTKGPRLSSYEELTEAGVPESVIDKCRAGEWEAPKHPELQQWYIYPKAE